MINLIHSYLTFGSIMAIPLVIYYYYLNTSRDILSLLAIYSYVVFTYPYLVYLYIRHEIN